MGAAERLVSGVVFVYDCSRLAFLLFVLAVAPKPEFNFSPVMYAAPNALFPLMSFFLLVRFDKSRPYIPLYMIGKALALVSLGVWLFFMLRYGEPTRIALWGLCLCAADLGTILGMSIRSEDTPVPTLIMSEPSPLIADAAALLPGTTALLPDAAALVADQAALVPDQAALVPDAAGAGEPTITMTTADAAETPSALEAAPSVSAAGGGN